MRIRTTLAAATLLLPLAVTSAGFGPGEDCSPTGKTVGEDPAVDIEVCTVETFLACPGESEANKTQFNAIDGPVALTETAPEASVQAGAGCGHLAEPVADPGQLPTEEELRVSGEFTGNLASIRAELHLLGPGTGQLGESVSVPLILVVDGAEVFRGNATGDTVVSDTNASVAVIVDLPVGLATEAGAGDTTRDVELIAGYPNVDACDSPGGVGSGCLPAGAYTFVWGTTEVPSGITFNPQS